MKLEDQVVSLALAKKLKELGYPQEGLWWWVIYSSAYLGAHEWRLVNQQERKSHIYLIEEGVVAPTVPELVEKLAQKHLILELGTFLMTYDLSFEKWLVKFGQIAGEWAWDESLASACAKVWIELKEEGLIK